MSNSNNEGFGGCLFLIICGIVAIILSATGALKDCSHSTENYNTSGNTYSRPWKKKAQEYERQKREQERQDRIRKESIERAAKNSYYQQSLPVQSGRSGSPRSNYQELWDESEDLEAALNDAGIDHEDLSYPMDYHDLEDLRDEYQSLLDENNIDY